MKESSMIEDCIERCVQLATVCIVIQNRSVRQRHHCRNSRDISAFVYQTSTKSVHTVTVLSYILSYIYMIYIYIYMTIYIYDNIYDVYI